jgi:hypothetical protein
MLLLAAALAIQVNVHPSLADEYQLLTRPTPDTYTCSVLVIDTEAKRVIAGIPKLVVSRGKEERGEKIGGEHGVELIVKIKPATNLDAQTAETHVIVKHNAEVIADQRSVVTLLPEPGKRFRYAQ